MTETPSGETTPPAEAPSPADRIRAQFPDAVEDEALTVNFPTLTIRRDRIVPVCAFVKETLGYTFPACGSGVDRRDHFEVVYHLYAMPERRFLGLKVRVPYEDARMDTVTPIWPGMDWHEREIYDLLGVTFDGHPDLRRLLLPDDWVGHPLRKSYTEID